MEERERKGREGKGREGKGREGKGSSGDFQEKGAQLTIIVLTKSEVMTFIKWSLLMSF